MNRLAGLFHAVALSTRSAHHLGHASFPALFAGPGGAGAGPPGSLLLVETGRNVTLLSAAQREDMLQRIVCLGARAGAAVLGGDRALSADTFAVGTVISPGEIFGGERRPPPPPSPPPSPPPQPPPLYFAAPLGGTVPTGPCAQPDAQVRSEATFAGRPPAFTGAFGASTRVGSSGGEGGEEAEDGAAAVRPMRAKCSGMAAFSHGEAPMTVVGELLRAAAEDGALAAAAAAAAAQAWGLARSAGQHACWGGDNPPPEAVAFAYLGGRVAAELGGAFRALEASAASGSHS